VLEMSVPEIAEQLVISAETVRSRLRLARTRLRSKGMNIEAGDDDVVSSDDLGGEGK